MTVIETHGACGGARVAMAMPSGAAANPHTFFYGYGGLSCASIGNCSAGGQYLVGTSTYEGFFINEVNGIWQTATEMGLPARRRDGRQERWRRRGLVSFGGQLQRRGGVPRRLEQYQALVVNEVGGHWRTGQKITLPTGNNTVGIDGGVYGLICHRTGPCTATGSYLKTLTNYAGFTVTTS